MPNGERIEAVTLEDRELLRLKTAFDLGIQSLATLNQQNNPGFGGGEFGSTPGPGRGHVDAGDRIERTRRNVELIGNQLVGMLQYETENGDSDIRKKLHATEISEVKKSAKAYQIRLHPIESRTAEAAVYSNRTYDLAFAASKHPAESFTEQDKADLNRTLDMMRIQGSRMENIINDAVLNAAIGKTSLCPISVDANDFPMLVRVQPGEKDGVDVIEKRISGSGEVTTTHYATGHEAIDALVKKTLHPGAHNAVQSIAGIISQPSNAEAVSLNNSPLMSNNHSDQQLS